MLVHAGNGAALRRHATGGRMNVAACIVTRGDVPLDPILDSLPPWMERVVWDNSVREDLAVFGRYAAIAETDADVIYVQDDDVILPAESIEALIDAYEPGKLVANMPGRFRHRFYRDHALVGFGALFDRDLPAEAFAAFFEQEAPVAFERAVFNRTCDVIFTALSDRVLLDLPYTELPYATAANRMHLQSGYIQERRRMLRLTRARVRV